MAWTTSYRHVEGALVQTYKVPEKALAAFRGRLGNLQKQGLFGPKHMPGRGTALRYGPDQLHRLIFACELFEFGVAPATVLDLVKGFWESALAPIFNKAEDAVVHGRAGRDDIVMYMGGVRLMTGAWSDAVPNVNHCQLSKLPGQMQLWMQMERSPARVLAVNLTSRLRQFHTVLADLYAAEIRLEKTEAMRGRKMR